jgi:hypothetical protein
MVLENVFSIFHPGDGIVIFIISPDFYTQGVLSGIYLIGKK